MSGDDSGDSYGAFRCAFRGKNTGGCNNVDKMFTMNTFLLSLLLVMNLPTGDIIPDFSRVGYHYGDDAIPDVRVVKTLHAPDGGADASAMIQEAIDGMEGPGAILLKAGKYNVGKTIRICKSGVVLRGEGDKTVIYGTGRSMYDLVQIGTRTNRQLDSLSAADVLSDVVCGQMFVEVDRPEVFKRGDEVVIFRPGTPEWIHAIGMDRMKQVHSTVGIVVRQWQPKALNLYWERKVMKIEGNKVYLDNPVVMELEKRFGGARLMKCSAVRVGEIGIENMSFDCAYNHGLKDKQGRCIDENHAWSAISMYAAEHCWVRKVNASHFGYSLVHLRDLVKNVTVRDCSNMEPVSRVRGQRRYGYCLERCELCLVENCSSDKDRHGPVTQARTCGPNVFVNFTMTGALSDAGPHYKWAQGVLYDNVRTDGPLTVQDRGGEGYGHGWTGCSIWMWNCEAAKIVCQNVYDCHKNFCVGCIGEKTATLFPRTIDTPRPDGVWVSHGKHVKPASLYYQQLKQRRKEGVRIYE